MAEPMTRPWEKIRETYVGFVTQYDLPLRAMVRLIERIEQSQFRALFAWTSMHDLCIVQTRASHPYSGPYLRISPLFNGTVEFRYIDTSDKGK